MYKLLVALAAMLAVAAAKPSLGYSYGPYVAPVPSYSAYSAPVYSAPVYPSYAAAPVHTSYAAAPVAAIATAPVATTYAAAAYPGYTGYPAPLAYANEYPGSFLWKKK